MYVCTITSKAKINIFGKKFFTLFEKMPKLLISIFLPLRQSLRNFPKLHFFQILTYCETPASILRSTDRGPVGRRSPNANSTPADILTGSYAAKGGYM